jgi:hypothetical protein
MTDPASPRGPRNMKRSRNIVRGIVRVTTGHADGLTQFGDTPEAFLASLAPLVAFPLVGAVLMLFGGGGLDAISDFLATLCALLAPPVLSHEVARLWGCAARWTRFAVAFNWCQWAIPVVASMLAVLGGILMSLGVPNNACLVVVVIALAMYGLWLHWFLARHGLGLGRGRAAILVLGVNLVTVVLVLGPRLLLLAFGGSIAGQ